MARGRTIPTFDPPPPHRQARDRRKPARNLSSSYRVIAVSIPALPNESGAVRDAVREDCVGGSQFEPYHLHHPVLQNCGLPDRLKTGRFCGDFRRYRSALSVSGDARGLSGRFQPPVSASKISVPDSDVRDRFDDWVGGGSSVPSVSTIQSPRNAGFQAHPQKGRFFGHICGSRSRAWVSADARGLLTRFWLPSLRSKNFRSR